MITFSGEINRISDCDASDDLSIAVSVIRWEIVVRGTFQERTKCFPKNAESFIVLCGWQKTINRLCSCGGEHM